KRKAVYGLISEVASHASFKGFALVANSDTHLGEIGPFFDEKKLAGWLQELAKHLTMFANILIPTQSADLKLLGAKAPSPARLKAWAAKYSPPAASAPTK